MPNWEFEEREGQEINNGKVRYPDHLTLSLTRAEALSIIEGIARQLRDPNNERVELYMAGTLVQSNE